MAAENFLFVAENGSFRDGRRFAFGSYSLVRRFFIQLHAYSIDLRDSVMLILLILKYITKLTIMAKAKVPTSPKA